MTNTNEKSLFADYPDIVSVEDLMEMLKIGKVLAYRIIDEKKVKAIKIGREYKITKDSVIRLINGD